MPPAEPDPRPKDSDFEKRLLSNIKSRLPELQKLLNRAAEHLADPKDAHLVGMPFSSIHRRWRRLIKGAFAALQDLMPDRPITDPFRAMVVQATAPNRVMTRPGIEINSNRLVEALVHAFFYLAVACRKARELETSPDESDEDWEAFLRLFGLGGRRCKRPEKAEHGDPTHARGRIRP